MNRCNRGLMRLGGLICSALFFASLFTRASAQDGAIKDVLEAYDHEFLLSYTLGLVASYPTSAFDMSQGVSTSTVTVTGDGARATLRMERIATEPVFYARNRRPRSYDEHGNYLLAYNERQIISLNETAWKVRTDVGRIAITQADTLASSPTMVPPRIEVYPPGHQDPANLFYRYLLPLGRGYAQLIDEITGVTISELGIASVEARGRLFSRYSGNWHLEIDTTKDYLVRRATFTQDGATTTTFLCESEDYRDADIPLFGRGCFLLTDYEVSVRLMFYSTESDNGLLARASGEVDDIEMLPNMTTIMDFNAIDGDGMPLVTRIRRSAP